MFNLQFSLAVFLLTALTSAGGAETATNISGRAETGFPMVNPSLDDPAKPWCYYTHPNSSIGMPWAPGLNIYVTPEGNLFTTFAELALFWGPKNKPLACRQRQFLDGWIPVVQDSWKDGALAYSYELFSAVLDGFTVSNTLQFVKLTIRNDGESEVTANALAAIRHNGGARRFQGRGVGPKEHYAFAKYNAKWSYEFKDGWLWRGGKAVCLYPKPDKLEAALGVPYKKPFTGATVTAGPRTELGLAYFKRNLKPGETVSLVFKMPREPVSADQADYLAAAAKADYNAHRAKTIAYWQNALGKVNRVHTPGEPLVEKMHRATAVHCMLGAHTWPEGKIQTDGIPYPDLFVLSLCDMGAMYDSFGLNEFCEVNYPHCFKRQCEDGLFLDPAGTGGKRILTAHGHVMTFMCNHVLMSRNRELGRQILPGMTKAVEIIRHEHENQPHGLMRPSTPFDNERIAGQYTSHNYFALVGLRSAVRLARFLEEKDLAEDWLKLLTSFESALLKAVRDSAGPDGYIPTGLYEFKTGMETGENYQEFQTDQDWENVSVLWPTELVPPGDPLIRGTTDRIRATKFREGIMTYRNGEHLHHYTTVRNAMQLLANGDQREALIDLYSILLHSGSAGEPFEFRLRPWTDRDLEFCPPPHLWGCSLINALIRHAFVLEQGGRGGIEPENRDIILFSAVSPAWLKDGEALGIEKTRTSFGSLTALMTPRKGGADVTIETDFHIKPRSLVVRIPYFVTINSLKSNAREAKIENGAIRLSPDATMLSLEWERNPHADKEIFQDMLLSYRREPGFWKGKRSEMPPPPPGFLTKEEKARRTEPLSFALVLDAWKTEYARRFAAHVSAGGPVKTYEPVPLQKAGKKSSAKNAKKS